jgi:hypothetical protein
MSIAHTNLAKPSLDSRVQKFACDHGDELSHPLTREHFQFCLISFLIFTVVHQSVMLIIFRQSSLISPFLTCNRKLWNGFE